MVGLDDPACAAPPRRSGFPSPRGATGPGRLPASGKKVGADEGVEVAVEDALDISALHGGAVILHEGVGLQDVGANLTAEVDLLLRTLLRLPFLIAPASLQIVQAGPQDLHRHVTIAVLRALVLA